MLIYSRQNIGQSDIDVLTKALKDEILTGGERASEFEEALCGYMSVKHACVLNSATSALHLAYTALDIKGKVVLTTPLTFAATASATLIAGAEVEFIDVKNNGNIDEKELEAGLLEDSRNMGAISMVNFGENSVEINEISSLARKYNTPLIGGASHALGALYKNKKVGKKTGLSAFSFHSVKPIATFEGGAVVNDNEELITRIKLLRSHGVVKKRPWDSGMIEFGYNYRLGDVACALGISQLKKSDHNLEKREEIASFYDREFEKNPYFSMIKIKNYEKSSRHLHPILFFPGFCCQKGELFGSLLHTGTGVQVHYKPTYEFSFYKKPLGEIKPQNADNFYKVELSIPCHQEMNLKDAKSVKDALFSILEKVKKGYYG